MCYEGKLWEMETKLREETEHLARDTLHIVLAADNDEARHLVADQHTVMCRHLILHAIEPLGHAEIERARLSPADRRGDKCDIRPMDERFVDDRQFVLGPHLRDRARPGASARRLGVIALAGLK